MEPSVIHHVRRVIKNSEIYRKYAHRVDTLPDYTLGHIERLRQKHAGLQKHLAFSYARGENENTPCFLIELREWPPDDMPTPEMIDGIRIFWICVKYGDEPNRLTQPEHGF